MNLTRSLNKSLWPGPNLRSAAQQCKFALLYELTHEGKTLRSSRSRIHGRVAEQRAHWQSSGEIGQTTNKKGQLELALNNRIC
jgi:hypothetical protein